MRFCLSVIMLCFLSVAVSAQNAEYRTKKYPNGNIRYEGWFVGDKAVKDLKRYHENGKLSVHQTFEDDGNSQIKAYWGSGALLAEGQYKGNRRDGEWKFYNADGGLLMIEHYDNGSLEGENLIYDTQGYLMDVRYYKNNNLDSVRLQYYPNGNVMAKYFYSNGLLDGEYRSYYYDGYPEYIGTYKNNKKDGWWFYTDDVGVTDSLFYVNGISDIMEDRIRTESDSSDADNDKFLDPENYMDNPFEYISDIDFNY